jgi:hypothetical protein
MKIKAKCVNNEPCSKKGEVVMVEPRYENGIFVPQCSECGHFLQEIKEPNVSGRCGTKAVRCGKRAAANPKADSQKNTLTASRFTDPLDDQQVSGVHPEKQLPPESIESVRSCPMRSPSFVGHSCFWSAESHRQVPASSPAAHGRQRRPDGHRAVILLKCSKSNGNSVRRASIARTATRYPILLDFARIPGVSIVLLDLDYWRKFAGYRPLYDRECRWTNR